ncbi:class I SAM-dependent methyltransferase [Natronomonas marina]|uniref:class I SAM-dependent methyltransferase n=1 Tax=Natronomonas marina TaxID=2961939 RepID=UPI0020C9EAB5|nr:class I SAM-dependent methyltransferase [Natronomonas marina]
MGFHTFDAGRADALEDRSRFRYCSAEELLGAAALAGDDTVVDIGSGTGFYTDVLAGVASEVYAVDVQPAMAAYYREKGVPDPVSLLSADADRLPLAAGAADVAVSTMTYHELPDDALDELARVVRPGGRLVVVDWTAAGEGEDGPPLAERFDAWTTGAAVDAAGFSVRRAESRRETFLLTAVR